MDGPLQAERQDETVRQLFETVLDSRSAPAPSSSSPQPYDRPALLGLCYGYAASDDARTRFATAFFEHAGIEVEGDTTDAAAAAATAMASFADHLVEHLFLPLRAVAQCRSVIDANQSSGDDSDDDDDAHEVPAPEGHGGNGKTNVYIFPPSPMTQVDDDGEQAIQSESGSLAADLLALIDPVALQLLRDGKTAASNTVAVDNAWAEPFARFQAVLEHPDGRPVGAGEARDIGVDSRDVDAGATALLLSLHARIARILHRSGAGAYVDAILADTGVEDMDAGGGTAHLGRLMTLRLEGWWDGGRSRRKRDTAEPSFWVETAAFTE